MSTFVCAAVARVMHVWLAVIIYSIARRRRRPHRFTISLMGIWNMNHTGGTSSYLSASLEFYLGGLRWVSLGGAFSSFQGSLFQLSKLLKSPLEFSHFTQKVTWPWPEPTADRGLLLFFRPQQAAIVCCIPPNLKKRHLVCCWFFPSSSLFPSGSSLWNLILLNTTIRIAVREITWGKNIWPAKDAKVLTWLFCQDCILAHAANYWTDSDQRRN